ncbi:MAG: Ig-like domain-containing protein [Limisphaerales bacterium]
MNLRCLAGGRLAGRLALITFLLAVTRAQAQPTIVSTVPVNGATGVSTTAPVVFTFSVAMNPTATTADFLNDSTFTGLATTAAWSGGNKVLTCTPNPAFPAATAILWFVDGQTAGGTALGGTPEGTFTTEGYFDTNQYTAFGVGDAIYYSQTSTAAPALSTNGPYLFFADITVSSNQSPNSATVQLPSNSVSNLTQNPVEPWLFTLSAASSNQTTLDNAFGNGNYLFALDTASTNELATIDLPATLVQPGAPQISDYTAAQSVNPAQAFTLTWEPFVGGTASDTIFVTIGADFSTAAPTTSNALPGTATSVAIPANTLQPGSNYDSFISFYHLILNSNISAGYTTAAYRYSSTEFNLSTTVGASTPVTLTNMSWSGHTFSFNVASALGQSLIIQFTTNTPPFSQWQTLLTTNSTTGVVQVADSANTTNRHVFYRAQAGP